MIKFSRSSKNQNDRPETSVTELIEKSIVSDNRVERVAGYAAKLALFAGKSEKECADVYDFAINHNAVEVNLEGADFDGNGEIDIKDATDLIDFLLHASW